MPHSNATIKQVSPFVVHPPRPKLVADSPDLRIVEVSRREYVTKNTVALPAVRTIAQQQWLVGLYTPCGISNDYLSH